MVDFGPPPTSLLLTKLRLYVPSKKHIGKLLQNRMLKRDTDIQA
jgi:hypothetical protein